VKDVSELAKLHRRVVAIVDLPELLELIRNGALKVHLDLG